MWDKRSEESVKTGCIDKFTARDIAYCCGWNVVRIMMYCVLLCM